MTSDPARPRLHLTAPSNWLSDPNAPLYWNGRHHLFYQHNPDSPQWGLMRWGHAVSEDLVHWTDLGVALRPTAGSSDADGCWSGCARVVDGRPVFFYTGAAGTGADHHQSVVRAVGDPELAALWAQPTMPVLRPPVSELGTLQQRDPFLLRYDGRWVMLLGTGLRTDAETGHGAVVAWESTDTITWSYRGLVFARPGGGDGIDTGPVWECPQLLRLDGAWVLIVSVQLPGPRCPYAVWFVGDFDGRRFVPAAMGLMDHGEVFYAPALTEGVADRALLWGWLQESGPGVARRSTPQGFAGAMSLPRELSVRDGRLHCRPAREVEEFWSSVPPLAAHEALHVPGGGLMRLAEDVPSSYRLSFAVDPGVGRAGVRLGAGAVWLGVVSAPGPRLVAGALRDGKLIEWYAAPLPGGPAAVELHVDAGIVEAFAEGRVLTLRSDPGSGGEVLLDATGDSADFRDVVLVPVRD